MELYQVNSDTGDSMDFTVQLLAGNTVIGTSDDPDDGPQNAELREEAWAWWSE